MLKRLDRMTVRCCGFRAIFPSRSWGPARLNCACWLGSVSYTHLAELRLLAIELVRRHVPDLNEAQVRVRDSRAGRYQSVTVTVRARDREQLDAIYRELSGHPQIALVL